MEFAEMTFTLYLFFFERLREYTAPRQMQTFIFGLYFASEQTKDISHIECLCLFFPPGAFFSLHIFKNV